MCGRMHEESDKYVAHVLLELTATGYLKLVAKYGQKFASKEELLIWLAAGHGVKLDELDCVRAKDAREQARPAKQDAQKLTEYLTPERMKEMIAKNSLTTKEQFNDYFNAKLKSQSIQLTEDEFMHVKALREQFFPAKPVTNYQKLFDSI